MEPLISILMTSYNREKYIAEAIESVLDSDYRNFELIIVDDRSKDSTVEIAKKYEAVDSRVKVYINETNLGDYPNRNKAASYAKGKYIKYIDADDAVYPWGIEAVVSYMEQFPEAGYGLDSIEQDPSHKFPFLLSPEEAYERNYFSSPFFNKAPTSCIIRKEVFDRYGGFSGKWMVGDVEMWHKLSRKENVLLMPHGIVWSRIHDEQESRQTRSNSVVAFRYTVTQLECINSNDCPLPAEKKQIVINKLNRSLGRSIFRSVILERNLQVAKEKMQLSGLSFFKALFYCFKSNG